MSDKSTKYYSSIQENLIATSLGWDVVSGSGSRPCVPGDVKSDDWLGECKTHVSEQKIKFNLDEWNKIIEESTVQRRFPVLFCDNGTQKLDHTWVLCKHDHIASPQIMVADPQLKVRKNIIFGHEDMTKLLKKYKKNNESDYFNNIVFQLTWDGKEIDFMPFEVFKEIVGC